MKTILKKLNRKLTGIEESGILKIYFILILFYILFHLPKILVLNTFSSAQFPLDTIYMVNNLLFHGGGLNPELASTIMSPSNATFIYPPGIYFLTYFLGSVKNIFLFLFFIQLVVPILVYRLYRSIGSPLVSLLLAILSAYYLTNANWWSPDHIIQPLLIICLIILLQDENEKGWHKPVYIGLITGIILILKHTVGIFWGGVIVSFLFFRSLESSSGKKDRFLLFTVIAGFLVCGYYFLLKQIFFDEVIFYLFPYFAFWGLVAYHALKNKTLGFNSEEFVKNTVSFMGSALIFPAIVFSYMGNTIGYAHYLESFSMGLPYLPIWDHGIAGTLEGYAKFQYGFTVNSLVINYHSVVVILMMLLPFAVNCIVSLRSFHLIRNKSSSTELIKYFQITSISILSILMFFPLESYHILSTKLFIFLFIMLYLLKDCSLNISTSIKLLMIAMLIPLMVFSVLQFTALAGVETSYGSDAVKKVIGMPIEKSLAEEIESQITVVRRATQGSQYYVIDTTGATLPWLMAIENNRYPEYYLEMRKGIMNKNVTEAILSSLQNMPFVLVDSGGYQKFLDGQIDDPYQSEILDFVQRNYVIIDRYEEPEEMKPAFSLIQSFIIMKKKT